MGTIRLVVRLPVLAVVTVFVEVLLVLGLLPAHLLGRREALNAWILRLWSRLALCVIGVRVEVRGTPPRAPFFLVSNHVSYLDIVLLGRNTGASFIAKSEVRSWPLMGWLARSVGTLFVDRGRPKDVVRVAREIEAKLARGRGLILFPEGTSTSGRDVVPFRGSLLAPLARSESEVHYASVRYVTGPGDPPARDVVAWWGDMAFGGHFLKLLSLRRIEARIVFGAEPHRNPDRKALAASLHQAVAETFEPIPH